MSRIAIPGGSSMVESRGKAGSGGCQVNRQGTMTKHVALVIAALTASVGIAEAGCPFEVTDQVRVYLGTPEWATVSYEHHFARYGLFSRDLIVQVEAGVAGGRICLGDGVLDSPKPGLRSEGGAVKLSVLHTWFEPLWAEADQTFVGMELEHLFFTTALGVNGVVRIGAFYRLSQSEGGSDLLVAAGMGIPLGSEPAGSLFGVPFFD